jgi:hypothetical protein
LNVNHLNLHSHVLLATTSVLAIFDFTNLRILLILASSNPMSSNRVATRSKNAVQRPGLLVPKQARRTSEEVAAERKAKEDAKREKENTKRAGIKRVADFERNQADEDAMEQTPRVVTKPNPLVRTRSYADVLRSSDVEMADGTTEPGSAFELAPAAVEAGQTTDDGMETAVQDLPPRKNVRYFFLFPPNCQLIR